jgi:hypothetical protein
MAVVVDVQMPGGNAQQYEKVLGELGVEKGAVAPGQLVRIARPADGGFRVTSVWESQGAFDAFRARLTAAMEKAGAATPSITVSEAHDLAK